MVNLILFAVFYPSKHHHLIISKAFSLSLEAASFLEHMILRLTLFEVWLIFQDRRKHNMKTSLFFIELEEFNTFIFKYFAL